MKIAIIGYSGSGKSTLARQLGAYYHAPVIHLDALYWKPGWQHCSRAELAAQTEDILDHQTSWVIDGNYSAAAYERRMREADQILYLDFPRYLCLFRALKRRVCYHGKTRPDMAEGCAEKFDWEFFRWLMWDGRTKQIRARRAALEAQYPEKLLHWKRPKQVEAYLAQCKKEVTP